MGTNQVAWSARLLAAGAVFWALAFLWNLVAAPWGLALPVYALVATGSGAGYGWVHHRSTAMRYLPYVVLALSPFLIALVWSDLRALAQAHRLELSGWAPTWRDYGAVIVILTELALITGLGLVGWWMRQPPTVATPLAPSRASPIDARTALLIVGWCLVALAVVVMLNGGQGRSGEGILAWLVMGLGLLVGGVLTLAARRGLTQGVPNWRGTLASQRFVQLTVSKAPTLLPIGPETLAIPSPQEFAMVQLPADESERPLFLGTVRLSDDLNLLESYVSLRNRTVAAAWNAHVDAVLSAPMPEDARLRPGEVLADVFTRIDEQEHGDEVIRTLVLQEDVIRQLYSIPLVATYAQFQGALRRRHEFMKDEFAAEVFDQCLIAQEVVKDPARLTPDDAGYREYLGIRLPELNFDNALPLRLPLADEAPHTYITGGTGSGKSELLKNLVLEYAAIDDAAIVVLDPHGPLAESIARREEFAPGGPLADRLVYIDPGLGGPGIAPTINPFDIADRSPRAVQVLAEQLTGAFEEVLGTRQGAALTVNMVNLLGESLRALLTLGGRDLGDLRRLLVNNPELVAACQQVSDDPDLDYFGVEFHKDQLQPAKESLQGKLKAVLAGNRALFVGRSTVDLDALTKARKIILFNLSKGTLGPLSSEALGRFIVASLSSLALRQEGVAHEQRARVRLIIDECHNFIGPSIRTILAEARKYELRLTLCQQYAGQEMTSDFRQAILANTDKKLCGQNQDSATRKIMAEAFGVDEDRLQFLPRYTFAVRWGNEPIAHVRARKDRLGRVGDMSDAQWAVIKAEQLAHYYRVHESPPAINPAQIIQPPPSGSAAAIPEPPPL